MKNDIPISKFHTYLRNTGLDELPQLYNILRGEMLLVGPRPRIPEETKRIMTVKPGLTGLAQVCGYRGKLNDLEVQQCIRLDKFYEEHKSFCFDLYIIWKTIIIFIKSF